MIRDNKTLVSDSQALSGTTRVVSTNVVNAQGNQWGIGEKDAFIVVLGADAGGTTPTLTIDVETHTSNDFSSARTKLCSIGPIAAADLVKGKEFKLPITGKSLGFLALAYTQAGTTPTNTVTAWIGAQ